MGNEEQSQKCSNSSSASGNGIASVSRCSKKQKQKKIPQRGLGVAQLEKIRVEEQQKKDAIVIPTPSFHSPSPSDLRPVNSNTVSLPNPLGWPAILVPNRGNVRKLWNSCDYHVEHENSVVDPGLGFRGNLNVTYESNPIWMQRSQQYQQSSSSMVKVPSATSSSSVLNFQMEPPSNQSYNGSNYVPVWPEEEKMVGMKRPYPFSLDNPPGHPFYPKHPSIVHPNSISYASASFGNGCTIDVEPGNPIFREGPSSSISICESNLKENIKESRAICGDFLTLAPPSMRPSSNFKNSSANVPFRNCNKPDFASLPYQEIAEDPTLPTSSNVWNQQHQPFYSFLPPAKMHIGHSTTTSDNCNGEVGENVDLNLKL